MWFSVASCHLADCNITAGLYESSWRLSQCTRWFKYDRDWFVCKQGALRSSCATLREWSHNLHPPSCSGYNLFSPVWELLEWWAIMVTKKHHSRSYLNHLVFRLVCLVTHSGISVSINSLMLSKKSLCKILTYAKCISIYVQLVSSHCCNLKNRFS